VLNTNKFIDGWRKSLSRIPSGNPYIALINQEVGSSDFTVTLSTTGAALRKLRFIAFTPDGQGAIGIAADVYL
jgi:hypothetical protein